MLPNIEELRDLLNQIHEVEEDNEDYRQRADDQAITISQLRHRISELMNEIRELKKLYGSYH